MKVLSVWHNFCMTVIKWDGIKFIPHCSWERHLNYRATSFMDTGEYICQLLIRILMELPIPLPAQEVENSVCHFQKMLFSINYRTTEKQVFQHYSLTRQTGLKINGKLKQYPPLLLGQLLKHLCHLLPQTSVICDAHQKVLDSELPDKSYKFSDVLTELQFIVY